MENTDKKQLSDFIESTLKENFNGCTIKFHEKYKNEIYFEKEMLTQFLLDKRTNKDSYLYIRHNIYHLLFKDAPFKDKNFKPTSKLVKQKIKEIFGINATPTILTLDKLAHFGSLSSLIKDLKK